MSEYNFLYEKLNENKDIEIEDVNREEIEDIRNIKINKNLSSHERIIEYLKKSKNPYMIKINDTLVKFNFGENNVDFQQCMNNIIRNNV